MARKSIDELNQAKAGSKEESKAVNPGGVYELPREDGSVDRIIVRDHPKFGTVQADAVIRVGYRFVRPATAEELQEQDMFTANTARKQVVDTVPKAHYDALEARLSALEAKKEKESTN